MIALLSAGPGWIAIGALKLLAGSFLAYFALRQGLGLIDASEPSHMYLAAFRYAVPSPQLALALTGAFVILSQAKINVTNACAGSIAWSNFFSRLTHSHPRRVVWLAFNVAVALLLMEIGVYKALEQTLALDSNVAIAWVGALVADLVVNAPLGLRPPTMEFKRAHLYDINPVGAGALAKALSPFVALLVAFGAAPAIAYLTKGRYYIAREPHSGIEAHGRTDAALPRAKEVAEAANPAKSRYLGGGKFRQPGWRASRPRRHRLSPGLRCRSRFLRLSRQCQALRRNRRRGRAELTPRACGPSCRSTRWNDIYGRLDGLVADRAALRQSEPDRRARGETVR